MHGMCGGGGVRFDPLFFRHPSSLRRGGTDRVGSAAGGIPPASKDPPAGKAGGNPLDRVCRSDFILRHIHSGKIPVRRSPGHHILSDGHAGRRKQSPPADRRLGGILGRAVPVGQRGAAGTVGYAVGYAAGGHRHRFLCPDGIGHVAARGAAESAVLRSGGSDRPVLSVF